MHRGEASEEIPVGCKEFRFNLTFSLLTGTLNANIET